MLKLDDLRALSAEELKDKAVSLKKELMQFRFQAKTGKLEQQTRIRETRRDIARILTVINEKQRAEAKP
jgi:large subunit ribosomal protein L29